MDFLPLLYARAARSGGPCVPFWGPDLRRQVAICPGVKEGRAGADASSRGEVLVALMGRVCGGVANRFLVYRYAPVCDVRKSRKVGHVSHVCGADAYRSS